MRRIYFAFCILFMAASINCKDEKVFRVDYQYFAEADGWFKLHQMPLGWQEARLRCAFEGAMLASPVNYGLTSVIKSMAVKQKVVVYTGIHATVTTGDFNSVEGIPLPEILVRWTPGNPDNQNNNEKCIVYHGEGLIEDVDCERPFPYICYRKHSQDMVLTECGTIDTEYKLDKRTNKCYKIHLIGKSFWVAAGICTAEGGHLAIINSDVEAEVMKDLLNQYPSKTINAWNQNAVLLGFYNWHDSNFFGTLHGESLKQAGYEKWSDGQPSHFHEGKPQRCGCMFRSGLLDDTQCMKNLAFVCEKHPDSLRKSTIDIRFGRNNI